MSTFTVVNETTLAEAIARCQSRLAYIAPGITARIVEAMATSTMLRLSKGIPRDDQPKAQRADPSSFAGTFKAGRSSLLATAVLAADVRAPARHAARRFALDARLAVDLGRMGAQH